MGIVVVLGCSGTAGSSDAQTPAASLAASNGDAGGGDGTAGSPSAEASVAGPASEAPAGGGGGGVGNVCELVTAEEVAGLFRVTSVKMTVLAGPPDNCIVDSETGDALTAWSLTTAQAKVVFDAFTVDPSTVQVTGIGDKAAIVQNTGLLVLKGDALVVIMISGGADLSEDEAIEVSKQIGGLAAGRM